MTTEQQPDIVQQSTVAAFLTDRVRSQVMGDRDRCTGISSDALSLYGVRGGPEPRPGQYPADTADLNACERTYLMAPDEVRERMLPVLEKYRAHVAARYADFKARGDLVSTEQQWPDEAVEAIKTELRNAHLSLDHLAKRLLLALQPHATPRTHEWEWGLRDQVDMTVDVDPCWEQKHPRSSVLAVVVRRRPAGPWEVVDD